MVFVADTQMCRHAAVVVRAVACAGKTNVRRAAKTNVMAGASPSTTSVCSSPSDVVRRVPRSSRSPKASVRTPSAKLHSVSSRRLLDTVATTRGLAAIVDQRFSTSSSDTRSQFRRWADEFFEVFGRDVAHSWDTNLPQIPANTAVELLSLLARLVPLAGSAADGDRSDEHAEQELIQDLADALCEDLTKVIGAAGADEAARDRVQTALNSQHLATIVSSLGRLRSSRRGGSKETGGTRRGAHDSNSRTLWNRELHDEPPAPPKSWQTLLLHVWEPCVMMHIRGDAAGRGERRDARWRSATIAKCLHGAGAMQFEVRF